MKNICIGLFGTCDNIRWRDPFMKIFDERGVVYFNPMVDDWNESFIPIEARHLAEDEIILFPILKDSYGLGSLAEVAFGPLKDIIANKNRTYIFLIDDDVTEALQADKAMAKASKRTRALVKGHLKDLGLKNLHLVSSLEEMLDLTLKVYDNA